jgi:hypothetical protein
VFQLDKSALTPLLARRPEVAREMCRLLSERQANEAMLFALPAGIAQPDSSGLLQWIRDGVKRFHQLGI